MRGRTQSRNRQRRKPFDRQDRHTSSLGLPVFFEEPQQSGSAKILRQLDLPGPVLPLYSQNSDWVVPQNLPSHSQACFIVVVLSAVSTKW